MGRYFTDAVWNGEGIASRSSHTVLSSVTDTYFTVHLRTLTWHEGPARVAMETLTGLSVECSGCCHSRTPSSSSSSSSSHQTLILAQLFLVHPSHADSLTLYTPDWPHSKWRCLSWYFSELHVRV